LSGYTNARSSLRGYFQYNQKPEEANDTSKESGFHFIFPGFENMDGGEDWD